MLRVLLDVRWFALLGVRGPYGQAYPIDKFRGREILIVGGGCGVGPLRALLFALFEDLDDYPRILVRVGARSPHDMVFRDAASKRWNKGEKVDVLVSFKFIFRGILFFHRANSFLFNLSEKV